MKPLTALFRLPRMRLALAFCVAAGVASAVHAQHVLCVQRDGKFEVVRRASGSVVSVQKDGQWVDYGEGPFFLRPVDDYLPIEIRMLNRQFHKGARAISDLGPARMRLVNSGRFVFNAELEAPCTLENVLLVLVLGSPKDGEQIYLHGVGHLDAGRIHHVSIDAITAYRLEGVGLKRIHLFADGAEVFHSNMLPSERNAALDRMIAARVPREGDGPAKPLFAPPAAYPATVKPKVKGEAVLILDVDSGGRVRDTTVESESAAGFAAAAKEAVRDWRFIPAIKAGTPVRSRVKVPVDFSPAF